MGDTTTSEVVGELIGQAILFVLGCSLTLAIAAGFIWTIKWLWVVCPLV